MLNKDEGDTFIRAIEVSNGHMDSGIRTGYSTPDRTSTASCCCCWEAGLIVADVKSDYSAFENTLNRAFEDIFCWNEDNKRICFDIFTGWLIILHCCPNLKYRLWS